jgi:hypothetical protein
MLILICAEAEVAKAVTKNRAAIVVTFLIFIFSKNLLDKITQVRDRRTGLVASALHGRCTRI